MKTQIEKTTATSEKENAAIIEMVSQKIDGLTRIEEAFNEVSKVVNKTIAFNCGKGGSHIWVSNWKNERLMLITETRYSK